MTSSLNVPPSVTPESQLPKLEVAATVVPAGFWYRVLAAIIDGLILNVINFPFTLAYYGVIFGTAYLTRQDSDSIMGPGILLLGTLALYAVTFTIHFFYYAWFYKNKGSTPGKMIFRMRVVDFHSGQNIGYGKTFLREFIGKFCSAIILGIGFLMVAFRQDKRALHDLIANTQVIRRV